MRDAHLRDFIAVAEVGSVRGAARRLGLTQGAVSKNLSALERAYGLPLLLRSSHGVEPTEYGRILLRRARLADDELRKAAEEMSALSGEHRGSISVGLSSTAEVLLAARALEAFRSARPEIAVQLLGGNSISMARLLREGRLDFAIVPTAQRLVGSDLKAERLLSTERVVVTRAAHPAARARDLRALAGFPWILGARPGDGEPALLAAFAEAGLDPPSIGVQRESFSALVYLLMQTDHVALTSLAAVQPFCRADMLSVVPLDVEFPRMVQHLIQSAMRPLTPHAALLAAEFRKARRGYRK